jgi:thioredoxin-dependent peroxiredoxin
VEAYRDEYANIRVKGAQVVGISADDVATQRRFKEQYRLPFALLSDKGGKVARKYGGVVPLVGVANRATFVVDRDGTVKEIVSGSAAIDPSSAVAACQIPRD